MSLPAATHRTPFTVVVWDATRVFSLFEGDYIWIAPSETVLDELLIDLGTDAPILTLFEVRLIWQVNRKLRRVVLERRVVPVDCSPGNVDTQSEQSISEP